MEHGSLNYSETANNDLGDVSGSSFQSLEELSRNKHLISELQKDEKGNDIRFVDGKKIIQIEEKTEKDKRLNEVINLWRMRTR